MASCGVSEILAGGIRRRRGLRSRIHNAGGAVWGALLIARGRVDSMPRPRVAPGPCVLAATRSTQLVHQWRLSSCPPCSMHKTWRAASKARPRPPDTGRRCLCFCLPAARAKWGAPWGGRRNSSIPFDEVDFRWPNVC